jgi:hypothetical protein
MRVNQWPTPAGITMTSPAFSWCVCGLRMEVPLLPGPFSSHDGAIVRRAALHVRDVGAGDQGGRAADYVVDLADQVMLGYGRGAGGGEARAIDYAYGYVALPMSTARICWSVMFCALPRAE